MKNVDYSNISNFNKMNSISENTFVSHLGIKVTKISKNKCEAKMKISSKLMAPNGFLHGGAVTSHADTTCGFGTMYHLQEKETFATVELKINFISTLKKGTLKCESSLVHKGKTLHVWDAKVVDEKTSKIIALFRCTQIMIKLNNKEK